MGETHHDRLRFSLPAGWQSDPSAPAWHQDGTTVTSAPGLEPLILGQPVQLTMTGSHAGSNLTPAGFKVDGLRCAAMVATSTTRTMVVNVPGDAGSSQPKGDNGDHKEKGKQNSARKN